MVRNVVFITRFVGGELNTCYEALDKHVDDGFGDQTAFIYDSPVANKKQRLSYKKMKEEASKFARVLLDLGVTKGDRVVIYMPMIPEVRCLALIDFPWGLSTNALFLILSKFF